MGASELTSFNYQETLQTLDKVGTYREEVINGPIPLANALPGDTATSALDSVSNGRTDLSRPDALENQFGQTLKQGDHRNTGPARSVAAVNALKRESLRSENEQEAIGDRQERKLSKEELTQDRLAAAAAHEEKKEFAADSHIEKKEHAADHHTEKKEIAIEKQNEQAQSNNGPRPR